MVSQIAKTKTMPNPLVLILNIFLFLSITNSNILFQLKSCHPNPQCITEYSSLFDGDIIHQAYLQIDPEPSFHITKLDGLEDQALLLGRVKNFDAIVKNVQALYEEELGMTLLVVPECVSLGRAPESHAGLEHMRLLLLLLLGAAVHCPNKELFITRIKELDVDLQHAIVECIKQVWTVLLSAIVLLLSVCLGLVTDERISQSE